MFKYFTLVFISLNLFAHPFTPCDEATGFADFYPCEKVDLLHRVHNENLGGSGSNTGADIWGWTDSTTGKEYALMTTSTSTAFVDISDPKNPVYLGKLNTATSNSPWRDVKTYNDYAFIVSEASGHGMQIFDLTRLRNIAVVPEEFTADALYTQFGNAHNIVINEATGFAYAVGTGTCGTGLHMVNIQDPLNPTNAGCFSSDGYTHDAQCVVYIGPDTDYSNQEICFNSNEDTLTIVDVSVKASPIQISRTGYDNSQYTHQGWLTEDQRYYLMNDELDEQNNGHNTKTYIWDLIDLDSPQLIGFYNGSKASIDHNLYIKGNYAYLTNYSSGLTIVDITDIGNANLTEIASFDSYPANDNAGFVGAWSNYPYFESGNVIMSDYTTGSLFILDPHLCPSFSTAQNLTAQAAGDNTINVNWLLDLAPNETYKVLRSQGGCSVDNFTEITTGLTGSSFSDNTVTGQVLVGYKIVKVGADGECQSDRSMCVETQTTGVCSAAPNFSGIQSVISTNNSSCGMTLQWQNASSYCAANVSYDIFKSTDPAFTPNPSNRIIANQSASSFNDNNVNDGIEYYYLVRATDDSNANQESNNVKLSDKAVGQIANSTWINGAEIGNTGFSQSTTRHIGWEFNTDTVHSGNRSYWSTNNSDICNDLVTETISLTAGQSSELTFWTTYNIEDRWDGGVVEVSNTNNLWSQDPISPNYPNTFRDSSDSCDYAENTPAFSGTNLTWTQHTMDLSSYQGQDINIRWNYSTDGNTNDGGWYLDDFAVTNTQVPSQCTTITDILFKNDFE